MDWTWRLGIVGWFIRGTLLLLNVLFVLQDGARGCAFGLEFTSLRLSEPKRLPRITATLESGHGY